MFIYAFQCYVSIVPVSTAANCLIALLGLFSPNLTDQSACKMGLALACVVVILHDDWSIRSGENRLDRVLKHLAAMLCLSVCVVMTQTFFLRKSQESVSTEIVSKLGRFQCWVP